MADRADITPELCRQLLRYEPETGKLFWRSRGIEMFSSQRACSSFNARFAGKEAFTNDQGQGYKQGEILYVAFQAHRVAWAIYHNRWPDDYLDHINGIRDDNRIENLREVTSQENSRNCRLYSLNTSGTSGVMWDGDRGLWEARITFDNNVIHLGRYDDKACAVAARKAAEKCLGFMPHHGSADRQRYPAKYRSSEDRGR